MPKGIPMREIEKVQKHFIPGVYDFTLVLKMGRSFRVDCSTYIANKRDVVRVVETIEKLIPQQKGR